MKGRRQLADARSAGRARARRLRVQRAGADRARLRAHVGRPDPARHRRVRRDAGRPDDPRPARRRATRRRRRLAVRRPARAEQGAARHRQGVRRVPPALRRPHARLHLVGGSSSHQYETALTAFVDALGLGDAVDDHRRRSARRADRVLRDRRRLRRRAASTKASASRCSRPCTTASRSSRTPPTAVPETLGDAGLLLDAKDAYTDRDRRAPRRRPTPALRDQLVEAGVRPAARVRHRRRRAASSSTRLEPRRRVTPR